MAVPAGTLPDLVGNIIVVRNELVYSLWLSGIEIVESPFLGSVVTRSESDEYTIIAAVPVFHLLCCFEQSYHLHGQQSRRRAFFHAQTQNYYQIGSE